MSTPDRAPHTVGPAHGASFGRFPRWARIAPGLCAICLCAPLWAAAKIPKTPAVAIDAPAAGSIVRPGSSVRIRVHPALALKASRVAMLVATGNELVSLTDDAPPFDVAFPLDTRWSGPIRIICSVLTAHGQYVGSGEVRVTVVPADLPRSIAVTDAVQMSAGPASRHARHHINVRGTYADGAVRDVGWKELGTSFRSSDTRVVTVDAQGFLTARGPGQAVVTVTNGALSRQVPVEVRPAPSARQPAMKRASRT